MSKKPAPDDWQPSAEGRHEDGHRHTISPDGSVRISFEATEVRNNEWFESPTVTEVSSGRTLLRLRHPWNAYEEWTGPRDFAMHVGKGPGRPSIRVEVNVDARTITIARTGKTYPLARAERVIASALRKYIASLPPPPPPPPKTLRERMPRPASGWKNWLIMMALAVGFYAVLLGYLFWEQGRWPFGQ